MDTIDIGKNIVIPETNDAPAALLEPSRASFVVCVVSVLATIRFDHQATLEADEIDDERAETMLAAEFEAA